MLFSAVVLVTTATRPAVALIAIVPVTSAVKVPPTAPPLASLIRKYPPAGIEHGPLGQMGVTWKAPVPVAELYWTDQPVTSTAVPPRLNTSMKSFCSGAPVFPPPP
jgi:hypothetical protein